MTIKISAFPNAATNMGAGDTVTGLQGGSNVNFSQNQLLRGVNGTYLPNFVVGPGKITSGGTNSPALRFYGSPNRGYGRGGPIQIFSGYALGDADGGHIAITAADSYGSGGHGNGGYIKLLSGTGYYGNGGDIYLNSGGAKVSGKHSGNIILKTGVPSGGGTAGNILMGGLPTSDPSVSGAIWASSGVLIQSGHTLPGGVQPESGGSVKISAFPNAATNMGAGDTVTGLQAGANVNFSQAQLGAGQLPVYTATAGTAIAITSGASAVPGDFSVVAGASTSGYNKGGVVNINAGNGYYGGDVNINAGSAPGLYSRSTGGNIILTSGISVGNVAAGGKFGFYSGSGLTGGDFHLAAGGGSTTGGKIFIFSGTGNATSGGKLYAYTGPGIGAYASGGNSYIGTGNGSNTNGSGGTLFLVTGGGHGTGYGGDLKIVLGGGGARGGRLYINNLPTTDPAVSNAVWADNGVVVQSGITNFSGTITTGSLVGKTITVVNGIITSVA